MGGRTGTRLLLVAALGLLCVSNGSEPGSPGPPLAAPTPLQLDPAQIRTAISLGYEERMRLGLGSPFRLIDFALHDPRLDAATRLRVARTILRGTLGGEGYQIDPAALRSITNAHTGAWPGSGKHHLRLIESSVTGTEDPRAGELAVRLAYQLAQMEGTIDALAVLRAAYAAALLRDREVARQDARTLTAAAARLGVEPVTLVPAWRRKLRFEVERPALQDLPAAVVAEAVDRAPALLARVRTRPMSLLGRRGAAGPPPPLMSSAWARALSWTAQVSGAPPQTAVSVRARTTHLVLRSPDEVQTRAWAEFVDRAVNEEHLVARRSLLLHELPDLRGPVAGVVLKAAVDLRTFAQERPWFPGFGGPTRGELMEKHGVWVVMDSDVPTSWGPYYRTALDLAVTNLRRALPGVSVRGLTVRVTREPGLKWALARHDPRTRVIELPTTTGLGTLAHEIAHDLDRQAARRIHGVRGAYASDRAARRGRGPLAPALGRLAEFSEDISPGTHPRALNPAEVLARNVDWYVTTLLAQRGISDGHLSSAQDEVLTGHGTVRPPGALGLHDADLRTIMRSLVPSRRSATRDEGLAIQRMPTATSVLGLVAPLRPPAGGAASAGFRQPRVVVRTLFREVLTTRDQALGTLDRRRCHAPRPGADSARGASLRRLVALGAAARARGIALAAAEELGGVEGRRHVLRSLYGPRRLLPRLQPAPMSPVESLLAEVSTLQEPLPAGMAGVGGPRREPRPCGQPAPHGLLRPSCTHAFSRPGTRRGGPDAPGALHWWCRVPTGISGTGAPLEFGAAPRSE